MPRMARTLVICVGKLKEPFFLMAVREYQKRLSAFGELTVLELPEQKLPENPSQGEIDAALAKEAEAVREKIPRGAHVIACTPEGREMSSEELASHLESVRLSGKSTLCFLVGSSFGMDQELKRHADLRLSFSKMTFPHHLFRVMLLEQIYRAESISAGKRYHK